jgi:hypothetical protein
MGGGDRYGKEELRGESGEVNLMGGGRGKG